MHTYLNFTMIKITSSLWDFGRSNIANTTITTCRWHFVCWSRNSRERAATRNPVEALRYE